MRKTIIFFLFAVYLLASPFAIGQDTAPKHLVNAQQLVQTLDLKNTSYIHGEPKVKWDTPAQVFTDCSGFIDEMLRHSYGYTTDDFKKWFNSSRPTAKRYHDKIVDQVGFTHIKHIKNIKPGDFLAVKYPEGKKTNTGHIMLVADFPKKLKADEWAITVIDCSESGHGPTDTRHKKGEGGKDHKGLGQGVFRLYADAHGQVVGYSWSTLAVSHFVAPQDGHLVIGRIKPNFKP